MDEIFLDCNKMTSKSEAHKYIKEMLNFPQYYGNNLDALWDILSAKSKMTSIFLLNKEVLQENLGKYGELLIGVFKDAVDVNSNIKLYFY